jgi:thiol peroxidase
MRLREIAIWTTCILLAACTGGRETPPEPTAEPAVAATTESQERVADVEQVFGDEVDEFLRTLDPQLRLQIDKKYEKQVEFFNEKLNYLGEAVKQASGQLQQELKTLYDMLEGQVQQLENTVDDLIMCQIPQWAEMNHRLLEELHRTNEAFASMINSHPEANVLGRRKKMAERKGIVTFKGEPMTLLGPDVGPGQPAPAFEVLDTDLNPVELQQFRGKVILISAVPSIDTPVCQAQTRRFNQEAADLGAVVLTISMDLPFAHKRFCAAEGIDSVMMLSDFRDSKFVDAYGVLVKELGLIARAVYVIDKSGKIVYRQIVPEITQEPDYEPALAAARQAMQ